MPAKHTETATSGLTQKQESFANAYVETGNASEAYRRAYDVGDSTKPETVWSVASRTLGEPKVAARVMELQELARMQTLVTVESLTAELEEARRTAMALEQPSAAVSAILGKARVNGLIIDKKELAGKVGSTTTVEHTLDAASIRLIKELVE